MTCRRRNVRKTTIHNQWSIIYTSHSYRYSVCCKINNDENQTESHHHHFFASKSNSMNGCKTEKKLSSYVVIELFCNREEKIEEKSCFSNRFRKTRIEFIICRIFDWDKWDRTKTQYWHDFAFYRALGNNFEKKFIFITRLRIWT